MKIATALAPSPANAVQQPIDTGVSKVCRRLAYMLSDVAQSGAAALTIDLSRSGSDAFLTTCIA